MRESSRLSQTIRESYPLFPVYFSPVQPMIPVVETQAAILIVEDELSFMTLLQPSLEEIPSQILSALNLHDAREIWSNHRKEIKVLITDFSLPDGFGSDLAAHFLGESADLKAVIITGFDSDSIPLPPHL